jgi:hypothetical protein
MAMFEEELSVNKDEGVGPIGPWATSMCSTADISPISGVGHKVQRLSVGPVPRGANLLLYKKLIPLLCPTGQSSHLTPGRSSTSGGQPFITEIE